MRDDLTVRTVQGIGDLFWVYQKLANHVNRLKFEVMIVDNGITQFRSEQFLKTLPKLQSYSFVCVSHDDYTKIASSKFKFFDIIKFPNPVDYAVNKSLEEGVFIEDIDKDYSVLFDIDLKPRIYPGLPENYITLFVSGDTMRHHSETVWSIVQWVDLIREVYRINNIDLPLYIIGAEFDRDTIMVLKAAIEHLSINQKLGIKIHTLIQQDIDIVYHILKNTTLFIGYQSGLNVLADNFNTKQHIIYFPLLTKMKDSWVKPDNRTNGLFNYHMFSDSPFDIARTIKIN